MTAELGTKDVKSAAPGKKKGFFGALEKRDGMPYNVARLSDGTTIPIEVPVQAEVVEERKSGKDVIMEVELTGHR